MNEKKIIELLQKDIAIPEIVQRKANLALEQIKKEGGEKQVYNIGKKKWRTVGIAAAAITALLGTMTVCAAVYFQWGKGLEEHLNANKQQKEFLEEQEIAAPVNNSITENGITITAQQSIVDSRFAHFSFKIEGYQAEEGVQPDFENIVVKIDGKAAYSMMEGSFFNGLRLDENKQFFYMDGTPAKENSDGSVVEQYTAADGSMEYILFLANDEADGNWIGKTLNLEFHNLGSVEKAVYSPDIEGTWVLEFPLKGSDAVRHCTLSEPLGDSGAIVIEAEISPISLYAAYDMPMRTIEIDGVDENGQPIKSSTFAEAPQLSGVRLKDGTLLAGITSGGSEGYGTENTEIYKAAFATDHIIDPAQVDALLFVKSYPEGEEKLTEENLYIVPIE